MIPTTKLLSARRRLRAKACPRAGTTSVEFALVFPIILTFFLSMTVFIQAFTMRDTAQHAAYEGAREGMKMEASVEECEEQVEGFLKAMRLRNGKVRVEPSVLDQSTKTISVRVEIPFRENAWIGSGFMPENWVASSEVTLTRYYDEEN